jgi:hypothetical protein
MLPSPPAPDKPNVWVFPAGFRCQGTERVDAPVLAVAPLS